MKPTVSEVRRENARRALLSFRRSRQGQPSSSFIGGLQAASKLGQGLPGTLGKGKAEGAGMENGLAWAAVGAAAGVVMCSADTFWMSIRRQITEAKREASAAGPPGVQANQD
jgi:hypothetical protein